VHAKRKKGRREGLLMIDQTREKEKKKERRKVKEANEEEKKWKGGEGYGGMEEEINSGAYPEHPLHKSAPD
jgi:hypothetical protein